MSKAIIGPYGQKLMALNKLLPKVAEWEDGLRAPTEKGNFEWWYFDAHFDDGSTAVVVYQTKAFAERTSDLAPRVQLAITTPAGKKLKDDPAHPPEQFRASTSGCDVQIGPSWVRGNLQCYDLHAEANGLAADLKFTAIAPPWRPGCGKTYFDTQLGTFFGWTPAIPFGTAAGTLTYEGRTKQVRGIGYHDHNWGNAPLERILRAWYWGRAHTRNYSAIFASIVPDYRYSTTPLPVFIIAEGQRVVIGDQGTLVLAPCNYNVHPGGRRYPRTVDIDWSSAQGNAHGAIRNPRIIDAFDPLEEFDIAQWKRILAKLLRQKPYYFRFEAELDLSLQLPDRSLVREQGPALYELMYFR